MNVYINIYIYINIFGDILKRQLKTVLRKPGRLRALMVFRENFRKCSNIFLQIAMTIYGNKNAEEMRTNSKMIYRNKRRKNYEKAGNYNL